MIVEVSVVPDSRRFSITQKGGRLKIALESPPENNRANIELIRELSRVLGRQVRIIGGQASKRKRLSIGIGEAEWAAFLASLPSG